MCYSKLKRGEGEEAQKPYETMLTMSHVSAHLESAKRSEEQNIQWSPWSVEGLRAEVKQDQQGWGCKEREQKTTMKNGDGKKHRPGQYRGYGRDHGNVSWLSYLEMATP